MAQTEFKTYRTKDYVTWEVDGKPYLLTEMSEGERNALMLATMYKSAGDVRDLLDYERGVEAVTGMSIIVCSLQEILMKKKEQSESEEDAGKAKLEALKQTTKYKQATQLI